MSHELIAVVTATPTGPISVGLGDVVPITASFTLDGPTDATTSVYDIVWTNLTESVGFAAQFPALPNTPYAKNFAASSVGVKMLRMTATFNSDATPPNNLQVVHSNVITVTVTAIAVHDEGDAIIPPQEGVASLPENVDAT